MYENNKRNIIAGWKDDLKPYKDAALFWHAVWISAEKPINNELHKIMKRTRNIYHLQIRKCKKAAEIQGIISLQSSRKLGGK